MIRLNGLGQHITHAPPSVELKRRLCGVGDEAAAPARAQIDAIRSLGWSSLELRSVDGVPLARLDDSSFERLLAQLEEADIQVPVLCSRIGSWAHSTPGAFEDDLWELNTLGARASRLGARYVRIMSYPAPNLAEHEAMQLAHERIRRLAEVARGMGLVLLHENCVGWAGGARPERVLRLIEAVGDDALSVLFDVGNGLAYGYDSVAFLERVLPFVAHVHVKDGRRTERGVQWLPPAEGDARLEECIERLFAHGYGGLFSIEPHLLTVPHLGRQAEGEEGLRAFVDYGRQFSNVITTAWNRWSA
jgi:L-ribulose-5-phosphate 3-epimerase